MSTTVRHTRKGRQNSRRGVLQQAKVSIGLAHKYAAPLNKAGWPAEKTEALEAGVVALEAGVSTQTEERSEARGLRVSEHGAIDGAKKFIRRLRNALPMVLRDAPDAEATEASFESGRLSRSTPKISAYLTKIRANVTQLDTKLRPYFDGKDASAMLDGAKAALDAADTKQEVAVSGLPQKTLKVYEAKGQVLEMIEDLNRVAKIAFDGQEAVVAEFNKEIVLRARRPRKKSKPAPKPTSSTRARKARALAKGSGSRSARSHR